MTSPAEMIRFRSFPLEIRRKIWKAASFIPRYVDIWNVCLKCDHHRRACGVRQILSRTPPPAILHVCHESREEANRHYVLGTVSSDQDIDLNIDFVSQIYVNPIVDTVCLPRLGPFEGRRNWGVADVLGSWKLKSLAINIWSAINRRRLVDVLVHSMTSNKFENVEELIFFLDSEVYTCTRPEYQVSRDYDSVFKDLTQDEIEDERVDHTLLGHFKYIDDRVLLELQGDESSQALAKYNSIRKRFCWLDGGYIYPEHWYK